MAEASEGLQDLKDHLDQLSKRGGTYPYQPDLTSCLQSKLRNAEDSVKTERGRLLQGHPRVVELLRRLGEIRGELNQLVSDIYCLERAGGLPKSADGWFHTATMMDERPHPNHALTAWIDRLLVDAGAELAD